LWMIRSADTIRMAGKHLVKNVGISLFLTELKKVINKNYLALVSGLNTVYSLSILTKCLLHIAYFIVMF